MFRPIKNPLIATLFYLKNVLYWPEDDSLRPKHVAVMWSDYIYIFFITVMIYCWVLTVYNTLYKFVNTQRDGFCHKKKKKELLYIISWTSYIGLVADTRSHRRTDEVCTEGVNFNCTKSYVNCWTTPAHVGLLKCMDEDSLSVVRWAAGVSFIVQKYDLDSTVD